MDLRHSMSEDPVLRIARIDYDREPDARQVELGGSKMIGRWPLPALTEYDPDASPDRQPVGSQGNDFKKQDRYVMLLTAGISMWNMGAGYLGGLAWQSFH